MLEDVALACLHMIRVKYVGDVVRTWCVFVLGKTYIPNFPFKWKFLSWRIDIELNGTMLQTRPYTYGNSCYMV